MDDATNIWDDVPDWGGVGEHDCEHGRFFRDADAVEHAGPEA
jgi:hypothetical protein